MSILEKIKCNNCNYEINGRYCSHCGQEVKDIDSSFLFIIKEFFISSFSLDSKIVLSFKYLFTKPGFLSKEFVLGRRTRYTSPFRIYLFISIISMIIISIFTNDNIHYLKFYDNTFGFVMASNKDGSGIQSQFGINVEDGDIKNAKQLYRSIQAIPLEINILSFIPKVFFCLFPIFAFLLKCFYWNRLYIYHLILALHNQSVLIVAGLLLFLINKLFVINFIILSIVILLLSLYIFLSSYRFYEQKKILTFIKFVPLAVCYFIIFLASNVIVARLFFLFPNIFK